MPDPNSQDIDRMLREQEARVALDRALAERRAMREGPSALSAPPEPTQMPPAQQPPSFDLPEMVIDDARPLPAFPAAPVDPRVRGGATMYDRSPPLRDELGVNPMAGPPDPIGAAPGAMQTPTGPGAQLGAPPSPATALPAPVQDASTDPNTPTITAGAEAARFRESASGGPRMALGGATGLGHEMTALPDRSTVPMTYEEQLRNAQREDDKLERRRRILKAVGLLGGLLTARGGGGGALPGLIGASLVRPSNNAERVQELDERGQGIESEMARRQAIMDQLAQRREAQSATERYQQQQLGLRAAELQGTQEDRRLRTGFAGDDNARDEADRNPASQRSRQAREALVRFARTLPPEVSASVLQGDISGMSAVEAELLMRQLGGVESGRQRGGGGGSGATAGLRTGQVLSGVNEAPEAFVLSIHEGSPSMSPEDARQSANIRWQQMSDERRANWEQTPDGVRARIALAQRIPGYEQENVGTLTPEQHAQARANAVNMADMEIQVGSAINAIEQIEALDLGEEALTRLAAAGGAEIHPAVSAYNTARSAIMGTLAQMNRTGVINESEYERFVRDMPDVSNPRAAISGTRRLQSVLDQAREKSRSQMRILGYRQVEGGGATPAAEPGTQTPGRPSGRTVIYARLRDGRVVRRTISPNDMAAAQAAMQRTGATQITREQYQQAQGGGQ